MTTTPKQPGPAEARVDYVVDENASPIIVEEDSGLRAATATEQAMGATGPTNWWRMGLLGLAIVVVLLGVLQIMNGAPGTDVQPGSPTAEPVTEQVQAP